MYEHWEQVRDAILDALFTPFPPLRAGARLARILHTAGLLRLARMGLLPVRRLGEEEFRGDSPKLLLTGNALHADIPPDAAGSGIFGWLLSMLGQEVGFPVPEGGAGRLAGALRERAESHGAQVRVNSRVTRVEVRGRRAIGVRLADGTAIAARRAVLADTSAPALYRRLLDPSVVPERMLRNLEHFQWDHGTLKLNWALGEPLALTVQELRAHVDRVEDAVERVAPGFRDRVVGRLVQNPGDLQSANANLVGGAINGGTASIHQQLVFRPSVGLGRPETPIEGLYLAGASAHPSGGVHGAAGWNAARSALRSGGPAGAARRALVRTAWARVLGD
nr:NAD(P)/FAD-dependent oxidoreductase [Actinomycetales bacterium]